MIFLNVVYRCVVFTLPLVSKGNHFGCLKLVICMQIGFLFASVVSWIAYNTGVCLPVVYISILKQIGTTKTTTKTHQIQITYVSGLAT